MRRGPRSPYAGHRLFRACLWAFGCTIFAIQLAPLAVMIPVSFTGGTMLNYPIPSLSMRWYAELIGNPQWINAIRNTIIVGCAASTIATVLGTLGALGITRLPARWQPPVMALLISPMIIPLVVIALAMFFFLAKIGLAATLTGLILAHAVVCLPLVVIPVTSMLQGFDAVLFRAALSLGATPARAFFKVVLPIILPGVLAGWVFAFATSIDEIVVALFVAGPEQATLPRQIFSGLRERISPAVAAVATLSTLLAIAMLLTVDCLRARSRTMARARADAG